MNKFVAQVIDSNSRPIGTYLTLPSFYISATFPAQELTLKILTTDTDDLEEAYLPFGTANCTIHLKPSSESADYNVFEGCILTSITVQAEEAFIQIEQTWKYSRQHIVLAGRPVVGRNSLVGRGRPPGWSGNLVTRKPDLIEPINWIKEGF